MLKKLLTLCLALAMLSVAVMASPVTYAIDADLADASITEPVLTGAASVDGSTDGQQVIDCDIDTTVFTTVNNRNMWVVYKFTLPQYEEVSKVEFGVTAYGNNSYSNIIVYPLSAAEYSATVAGGTTTLIAENGDTLLKNILSEEAGSREHVIPSTKVGNTQQTVQLDMTDLLSDAAKAGEIYVAIFAINNKTIPGSSERKAYLKNPTLAVTGTLVDTTKPRLADVVFVDGSTDGQQVIECNLAETDSRQVSNHKWVVYKFTLPQYEEVAQVELGITVKGDTSYTNIIVYPLRAAEYSATVAGGSRTLSEENGDTLLKNILLEDLKTRDYFIPSSRVGNTQQTVQLDMTDLLSDAAKTGEVYVAVFAINNQTVPGSTERFANLSYPTLTVEVPEEPSPTVDDFSDAVIAYDNSTGEYTITTTTTTGEAYLIIASFTGNAMNDVELVAINAAVGLSGIVDPLDAGTIKIFLLDKATLAPAIGVTPAQN